MTRPNVFKKKRSSHTATTSVYSRAKKGKLRSIKFPNLWFWVVTLFTSFVFIAILSFGLLYLYRFFTVHEYFSVKEVQVSGNVRLGSGEVLALAGIHPGMNSLAVRMGDVEARLLSNPWISGVSVKRELPSSFFVTIRERTPKYWIRMGDRIGYADANGVGICDVVPGKFTSLPYLSVDQGMEVWGRQLADMVGALEVARLPLDMNNAAWVRLSRSTGVELFLENSDITLSIGVEDWNTNLNRLAKVLEDLKRRGELKSIREIKVAGSSVWVKAESATSADS